MALSYITIAIVCFKQFLRKIVLSAIVIFETLMQVSWFHPRFVNTFVPDYYPNAQAPKTIIQIESKYNIEVQVTKAANSICSKLPNALLTVWINHSLAVVNAPDQTNSPAQHMMKITSTSGIFMNVTKPIVLHSDLLVLSPTLYICMIYMTKICIHEGFNKHLTLIQTSDGAM